MKYSSKKPRPPTTQSLAPATTKILDVYGMKKVTPSSDNITIIDCFETPVI